MQTLEVINKRASLKTRISTRDVEEDLIARVLGAARLAPSARNNQPWRFIVVKGREAVESLVSKAFSGTNQVVKEAPVIIIACAKPSDDIISEGKEYYLLAVGMAVENILLAATDLGLVTHPMTGVNEGELKRILGIPQEVRFVIATPLAYPAEGSYDEAARERLGQRARKSLKEFVYSNTWGKPL
jgi:nitroreductase